MEIKISKDKKLFWSVFSFITEYFNLLAKTLCDSVDGFFSEATVSSWKTRSAPKSRELFDSLLLGLEKCLTKEKVENYFDKNEYVEKICSIIEKYCKIPNFLLKIEETPLIELVLLTIKFAFLHKDMKPSAPSQNEAVKANTNTVNKKITSKTAAVVFDFDGTLTVSNKLRTTWETLWTILGYDIDECEELHAKFSKKEITHEEWCLLTEKKFIERKLCKDQLDTLIEKTELIDGIEEVFSELDRRDIKVYIVSGSIKNLIRKSLGGLYQYVSGGIDANEFDFDEEGYLTQILGTEYDFEGKAKRIAKIAEELRIRPDQVLFVGNSLNDEWVRTSGARTLAVNPKNTNMYNKNIWDDCIVNCRSLKEIMKYV